MVKEDRLKPCVDERRTLVDRLNCGEGIADLDDLGHHLLHWTGKLKKGDKHSWYTEEQTSRESFFRPLRLQNNEIGKGDFRGRRGRLRKSKY